MEFLALLNMYGHSVEDCAVVTVGTDGLDPSFNSIACVSVLPIMGDKDPVSVYIEGADIYSTAPYTRLNETTYQVESVSRPLARARIYEMLEPYPILVGHTSSDFLRGFLRVFDSRLMDKMFLDTLILAHYYYQRYPDIVGKVPSLENYQNAIAKVPHDKKRDWRLCALCKFESGDMYNIPERNAVRTKSLFIYLLGREAPIPREYCP